MRKLGKEIYRTEDAFGSIVVYQDGEKRLLAFGNQVEQSCFSLLNPSRLEYVYTQAMMLSLLFMSAPRRVLILGLGGASLVRAIRAQTPKCRLYAVESRSAVAQIAQEYFFLEKDKYLTLCINDAGQFLQDDSSVYDLIFADLYHADGMDRQQTQSEFLALCKDALSAKGILALNLWCSEYRSGQQIGEAICKVFEERVLFLHVQGGNIIVFAFADALPALSRRAFFEAAQRLGLEMDIPLQKLARNLWRQNAQTLQLGRFRRA
jgi:spermidine synthase